MSSLHGYGDSAPSADVNSGRLEGLARPLLLLLRSVLVLTAAQAAVHAAGVKLTGPIVTMEQV